VRDLVERVGPETVRTLLLDRPYGEAWDYDDAALEAAGRRLDALHTAAGRTGGSEAATAAALTALGDDLDVSGALDVAVEAGGQAARELVSVLSL
jgi:cysteinyl-tRNA synthetase